MRDHGGNLDAAIAEFGGEASDWLDLSTGINPCPYPLPKLSSEAWNALPTKSAQRDLVEAAQQSCGTTWACLPTAGAQAGIQMLPRVLKKRAATVLTPTYNEHAASFEAAGWPVDSTQDFNDLAGSEVAIVVNPNNPTGELNTPQELLELANRVGILIIDESFCDPHPENSVLKYAQKPNVVVLRSFGKFFGLAGLRLGFAFGANDLIGKLSEFSGPWPVSGPAIQVGQKALGDSSWHASTIQRLAEDSTRMDDLARAGNWCVAGGTTLFRLYAVDDAVKAQEKLAHHHIWSRIFPYSNNWIRLGLPYGEDRWAQLEKALTR